MPKRTGLTSPQVSAVAEYRAPTGSTSLPVVDESIVDLVGIRMGMNCGPMLPLMPTTEPLWSLFVQLVPLCFWL
jgi:hypothetical protein